MSDAQRPETGEDGALPRPRLTAGEGLVSSRPLPGRWVVHVPLLAEDEEHALRLGNLAAAILANEMSLAHASAAELSLERNRPLGRRTVFCGARLSDGYRCDLQPGHRTEHSREVRYRTVPASRRNERIDGTTWH